MAPPPTESDRQVAYAVADGLGGRTPDSITRHTNVDGSAETDLLAFNDAPVPGCTVYATLGLSAHPIGEETGAGPQLRVEFIGACQNRFGDFPGILATAAFDAAGGRPVHPNRVFTEAVTAYRPDLEMRHLLFGYPFMWGERFSLLELPDRLVTWLQPVPIAERELVFADANGIDELIAVLQEERADITDLGRPSIV
jgi:hypothetical protein